MMMVLPPEKLIKDALDGLLGREVSMKHSDYKLNGADTAGGMIATYCDDDSRIRAISGWSAVAAAHVGGALGLVPAAVTTQMAQDRYLKSDVAENLAEVCNVLAGTFEQAGSPHVRLQKTYYPAATAPPDVAIYLYQHAARYDLDLEVSGYGTGLMSTVIFD